MAGELDLYALDDPLPSIILELFEQALLASDYMIAFRMLRTLEKYLLKDGCPLEHRIESVVLLVEAHRRLLEQHTFASPPAYLPQPSDDYVVTRH